MNFCLDLVLRFGHTEAMHTSLPPVWTEKLKKVRSEPYFRELTQFLNSEYQSGKTIYPAKKNIFQALQDVDLPDVKVVILGQDPYHGPGQAIGRSFAVPNDLKKKPPSLQNIFKELQSDLGITVPKEQSDLKGWAQQGVLLLNTILTVEAGRPLSHQNKGWEKFTDQVMDLLNESKAKVFILWGAQAQKMKVRILLEKHAVLESVHPSPLSSHRGFFGSKPFSKTNRLLQQFSRKPIDWTKVSD